jgi:hypothetical protein
VQNAAAHLSGNQSTSLTAEARVQNLEKHRETLATQLRRTNQMIGAMLRHVTQPQLETLWLPHLTMYERAERLVDLVSSSSSEEMYQSFLNALSSTDQLYLRQLLEQQTSGTTLNLEHRDKLTDLNTFLIDNMDCTTHTQLLDHLLERGVLNEQEVEEIKRTRLSVT